MTNFNDLNQKKSICVSCDKETQTHNICMDCIIKTTKNESNQDYAENLAEDFIKELQVASASINRAIKLGFVEGYNKAKAQHEVELSVRELHNYKLGLEDGYNKAKKNTYTEEQVRDAMYKASRMSKIIGIKVMIDLKDISDFIKSLK